MLEFLSDLLLCLPNSLNGFKRGDFVKRFLEILRSLETTPSDGCLFLRCLLDSTMKTYGPVINFANRDIAERFRNYFASHRTDPPYQSIYLKGLDNALGPMLDLRYADLTDPQRNTLNREVQRD